MHKDSAFSTSSPTLNIFYFRFDNNHSNEYKVVFYYGFALHFPNDYYVEIFLQFIVDLDIFSREMSVQTLCLIFNWIVCILVTELQFFLKN